jgi:hypothetical protein
LTALQLITKIGVGIGIGIRKDRFSIAIPIPIPIPIGIPFEPLQSQIIQSSAAGCFASLQLIAKIGVGVGIGVGIRKDRFSIAIAIPIPIPIGIPFEPLQSQIIQSSAAGCFAALQLITKIGVGVGIGVGIQKDRFSITIATPSKKAPARR